MLRRGAADAAPALLGCRIRVVDGAGQREAVIVETEAYLADDPACHGFNGETERNRSMFAAAGLAYVYRIHRSYCFNVVTGRRGSGEAVLIRAVEPREGLEAMRALRAAASVGRTTPAGYRLCNGPGKLCQALGIGPGDDGRNLFADERVLLLPAHNHIAYDATPRIGISKARDAPLRFVARGNPWTSRPLKSG